MPRASTVDPRDTRLRAAELAADVICRAGPAKTSLATQYLALCRMIETYIAEGYEPALMVGFSPAPTAEADERRV